MSTRNTLAAIGRLAEFRTAKQLMGDKKRAEKLRKIGRALNPLIDKRDVKAIESGGRARKGFKRRVFAKGAAVGATIGGALGALANREKGAAGIAKGAAVGAATLGVLGGARTLGTALLTKKLLKRKKRR